MNLSPVNEFAKEFTGYKIQIEIDLFLPPTYYCLIKTFLMLTLLQITTTVAR